MHPRIVEVYVNSHEEERLLKVLRSNDPLQTWVERLDDKTIWAKVLMPGDRINDLLDQLENELRWSEGFQVLVLNVEASLPRNDEEEGVEEVPEIAEDKKRSWGWITLTGRVSREELYTDVSETAELTSFFLVMVTLSTIIAAIGLVRDSVAIIIGAMVIAPLLGPNVALSLATTLGDPKLGRRALLVFGLGVLLSFILAMALGMALEVDPSINEIASRTEVRAGDVALAIAAGCAGAISFTVGISSALIGVTVAVALLPPLVVFGMLLGAGYYDEALGAFLLVSVNVVGINLAGVATFIAQGVKPRLWYEAKVAKRESIRMIALWSLLLILLVIIILLSAGALDRFI
jgi:uncharacterized hydrophobic protein (TIGR00341 family)